MRIEQEARRQAAYQFEVQANKLYLAVQKRLTNYRYTVLDETSGNQLHAVVLANSFDFYEYRLHRAKQRIDLLIVQCHNAVTPIKVLCLDTAAEYDAGSSPTNAVRIDAKRRNRNETQLLVSKLILGLDSAKEDLAAMPIRTRQRYLQRCRAYLKPRIGRPIAS